MNIKTAILVPMPGMIIKDPILGTQLPVGGRRVEMSTYWARRINEGSVRFLEEEKPAKIKEEPKQEKKVGG